MKKIIFFLVIILSTISCTSHMKVGGIYRYFWGKIDNYNIWIIDGNLVRQKIYNEFLYGGNEQRYLFVQKREIWIDGQVSCEETMEHIIRSHLKVAITDSLARNAGAIDPDEK